MKRCLLALGGVLLAASAAHAELKIENVEACYGRYGSARLPLFYPGERIWYRFLISAPALAATGDFNISATFLLKDETERNSAGTQSILRKNHPSETACLQLTTSLHRPQRRQVITR